LAERSIVRVVCGPVGAPYVWSSQLDAPRRRYAHGRGDLALVVLDSLTARSTVLREARTTHVISLPETHWTFFCRHAAATC